MMHVRFMGVSSVYMVYRVRACVRISLVITKGKRPLLCNRPHYSCSLVEVWGVMVCSLSLSLSLSYRRVRSFRFPAVDRLRDSTRTIHGRRAQADDAAARCRGEGIRGFRFGEDETRPPNKLVAGACVSCAIVFVSWSRGLLHRFSKGVIRLKRR